MNTTSNISAMKISGVTNAPASASKAASPQDLLGFLSNVIQQLQATSPTGVTNTPAQNSPQDLKGLTEKIAAMLKKQGISLQQLQSMPPADAAAQIAAMLQQQPGAIPPALLGMSTDDLAARITTLIQQSPLFNAAVVKPTLTSDLTAPQSLDAQKETKADVAKKITDLLEGKMLPDQAAGGGLDLATLRELKADIAELQKAAGTLSPEILSQLKTDIGTFLQGQGVDQATIAGFMADMDKVLQAKAAEAPVTDAVITSAAPTQPTAAQAAVAGTAADAKPSLTTGNVPAVTTNAKAPKNEMPSLGGKNEGIAPKISGSSAEAQPQPAPAPQPANVTAKISGMSINPALINDLAQNGGGFGNDSGFGAQGNAGQNASALLSPVSADALQPQNFTNYLNAASGSSAPSATMQMVNIQLQRGISDGVRSMTLQLEPIDLGRMDVKLKFEKDGSVRAHMTVDKPETLALLQKDAHHLTRALRQSGIDTDEASISFDLRQNSHHDNLEGFNGNTGNKNNGLTAGIDASTAENSLAAQIAVQSYGYITQSGVNIMV